MPEESDLRETLLELESDITDRAKPDGDSSSGTFRETAFTEIVCDELALSGVLESPVVCHFEGGHGPGSFKVNGYSVPEEDTRLDLFITLYSGPSDQVQTINAANVEGAFNKLERYFARALAGHHEKLEPGLDPYYMTERIHRLRGKIDRVNYLFFTNARLAQRRERQRKTKPHELTSTYEVWDLERLRRLRESGMSHEALHVELDTLPQGGLPAVKVDGGRGDFQTWVTVFPGTLLAHLYDEYGLRLLELNVRSYLQARGKVNKGILETLRKHPEDFVAYNNGITVVAEEVLEGRLRDGSHGILTLRGMSIVNGGQTTASIHRAAKEFNADLSVVSVQGKITVVAPSRFQEVVPLISKYSNTQNKVTESDLTANHSFHIGIERVSRREWTPDLQAHWFYERARGSYQTTKAREGTTPARRREFELHFPPDKRFTKEDLAKFENVWLGLPHIASRGAQKNFVHFMTQLGARPDNWEPTVEEYRRYVAKGILYKDIQQALKRNEKITAYRVNVTAYTAALIAEKTARRIDLNRIWRDQKISPALQQTVESWAPIVFSRLPELGLREGRHIEESFKTQPCWDYIRSLAWILPAALEGELEPAVSQVEPEGRGFGVGTGERLTVEDHNNIARCKELIATQWLRIEAWGRESGKLEELERGIAHTLAGYAAEGWSRSPSKKQAKRGAAMIEKAHSAGILNGD